MEEWQVDFELLRVRHYIKDSMHKKDLPSLNVVLFLIGIQEVGIVKSKFTKEEKADLMHVAVATLLEPEGYFEFDKKDDDNWPHWNKLKPFNIDGTKEEKKILNMKIIEYFADQLEDK